MMFVSGRSRAPRPSLRRLVRGLHKEFANWYVVGPLSWVVGPSRFPPRRGFAPLAGKHVTVKMRDGSRAECRLDEFYPFREVFALRTYDVPGLPWADVRTIVDVGANVGAATLWFARQAPQATIVAVEPASSARSVLTRNIRRNRLEDRVEVVAAALAGRSGTVELEQSGTSVHARIAGANSRAVERVRALSLEELLDACGLAEVDLLKLDCEGAEFEVLLPTDQRALRRNRVIIGEYHVGEHHLGSWADLEKLTAHLEKAGFITSVSGSDVLGLFQAVRV